MVTTREVVIELLSRIAAKSPEKISLDDRLVDDLQIDGDDFGMWFVRAVRDGFHISPSLAEWEKVTRVRDVIALVERHQRLGADGTE